MATLNLNDCFPADSDGKRGPLPKQADFLRTVLDVNGPSKVAYFGGYGCLRGDTLIETREGPKAIKDIQAGDWVLTATQPSSYAQVGGSYPKGQGRLYRVVHERGEFYASAEHQSYVVGRGYLPAFELKAGDLLGAVGPQDSTEALSRSGFELSAQHLIQTSVNFLEYCLRYCHQYDRLPQEALDSARALVPLLNDALRCSPSFERGDDLQEQLPDDSRLDLWCSLLANYRSYCLSAHHAPALANYIVSLASAQTSGVIQELRQSLAKFSPHHMPQLLSDDRVPLGVQCSYRIISVVLTDQVEAYYDLEVLSTGHYVDSTGVVHHNSGKSLILCITMITQGVLYGGEYVIAREFMPELRRTTMKLFLELLPPALLVEHRVADAEIHIKTAVGKPAIFYFVGLDTPDKLDSLTLSGAAIDEASQVSEEAFLKLQGRVRHPQGLRKILLVGNPKGHDWVYRYFIKQDMFKEFVDKKGRQVTIDLQKKDYRLILAPSTENIHLPDGYIEGMLASYSAERIARDVMGSFDSFEGQVYGEFDRQVHVVRPFRIPDTWTRVIGADHGYRNPAAFLWGAIDGDDNVYIYREFYQRELLIEEIVKGKPGVTPGIVRLNGPEKIDGLYIDPSIKATRGQTGESEWATYQDHLPKKWGMYPAQNDVETGIERVKSYLKVDEKTGRPRIYIFDTCVNLLDEISEYRYQELSATQTGKTNEKETPRKYHDHAVDALRYLIMSRPEGAVDKKENAKAPWGSLEQSLRSELKNRRKPPTKDPFGDT